MSLPMVKNTENNHDGAYKKIFSHPEMVESLVRDFVPEDWVRELELISTINEPRYLSLRRAFTVWIRRLLLGRLNFEEPIPEVCDLQEVDHMLAERMTQWTETWEERGMQKGIQKGELQGQEKLLKKQMRKRFGNLFDIHFQERLRNATPEQLERWADRILDARTIEEVFEEES